MAGYHLLRKKFYIYPCTLFQNMTKSFLSVIIIVLGSVSIYAQEVDSTRTLVQNGWIEKMNDKIALDVSLNNSYSTFEVKTETNRIILYPNTPSNLRLKLNYRFISFAFQLSPDFLPDNGDEDLKGKTKSFAIGTGLIFKHWFFDVSYSKVRGYYLKNTNDFIPQSKGDPFIQFPDLYYQGISLSSGYYNNSKFSFRSLTSQTERQLKSAGSFIPVCNFSYFIIDDKSNGTSAQKSNNTEINIGPGYAYTFVLKEKFYLSLGVLTNFGYLNTKLTTKTPSGTFTANQDNFIFRWDGKTGIGYNGSKFYSGLYANLSGTQYRQENTTAMNFETRVVYHLFIGMRINSPKVIDRQIDKIENKFP